MLPWFTPLTQSNSAVIVVGFSIEVGYGDLREMRARLELMSPSFYCCTSIYIGASAGSLKGMKFLMLNLAGALFCIQCSSRRLDNAFK